MREIFFNGRHCLISLVVTVGRAGARATPTVADLLHFPAVDRHST